MILSTFKHNDFISASINTSNWDRESMLKAEMVSSSMVYRKREWKLLTSLYTYFQAVDEFHKRTI